MVRYIFSMYLVIVVLKSPFIRGLLSIIMVRYIFSMYLVIV